jgi:hypothetical protein
VSSSHASEFTPAIDCDARLRDDRVELKSSPVESEGLLLPLESFDFINRGVPPSLLERTEPCCLLDDLESETLPTRNE